MDFELTPKRRCVKPIVAVLFVIILVFVLWLSNSDNRNYPYLVEGRWVCTEPYFSLLYNKEETGKINRSEIIKWDNQVIEVEIGFLMKEYCVYPEGSSSYDDRLLSGTWKYRDGNLVFFIFEDFIFNEQYSELIFAPIKLE